MKPCATTPDEVFSTWPALIQAVPPEKPQLVRMNLVAPRLMATAEFRSYASDSLVGPFSAFGDCLRPLCGDGARLWFDPHRPARDGDAVLVMWSEQQYQEIVAEAERDYQERYGMPVPRLAVKFLYSCGLDWFLANREKAMPLGDNQILGVLSKHEGVERCQVA